MFWNKRRRLARFTENKNEVIISGSTDFRGVLKSDGVVRIFGVADGEIETASTLIVGKTGRVTAEISGQNVVIAGRVRGNVIAAERLEIVSGGQVYGDVVCRVLDIEEGAIFVGRSQMRVDSEEAVSTTV